MGIDPRTALKATKVVDGAWPGELDKLGCPPGHPREEWNLSHPDLVSRVAAAYLHAGSSVILTNTLHANAYALEMHDLADKVESINLAAARISRQVAGDKAWVFGLIGPTGRIVMAEEVTEDDLQKAFRAQAQALAAGGVDAIVCETITELAEALAAVRAVKQATSLPIIAGMTFDTGPDGLSTTMGVEATHAVEQLSQAGADGLGCTCGVDAEACIKVVQHMRQHTHLPIWARPDAAEPEIIEGRIVHKESPAQFAAKAHLLLRAGANFIGGCCGTTPQHIAAVTKALQPWLSAGG